MKKVLIHIVISVALCATSLNAMIKPLLFQMHQKGSYYLVLCITHGSAPVDERTREQCAAFLGYIVSHRDDVSFRAISVMGYAAASESLTPTEHFIMSQFIHFDRQFTLSVHQQPMCSRFFPELKSLNPLHIEENNPRFRGIGSTLFDHTAPFDPAKDPNWLLDDLHLNYSSKIARSLPPHPECLRAFERPGITEPHTTIIITNYPESIVQHLFAAQASVSVPPSMTDLESLNITPDMSARQKQAVEAARKEHINFLLSARRQWSLSKPLPLANPATRDFFRFTMAMQEHYMPDAPIPASGHGRAAARPAIAKPSNASENVSPDNYCAHGAGGADSAVARTAITEPSNASENVSSDKHCAHCGSPTHKQCAGCKMVRYCSITCQRTDWLHHKKVCRRFAHA